MNSRENNILPINRKTIVHTVVTLIVLILMFLLIRRLSGVLLPFCISFVIAYILAPVVNFFQHKCRLKNRILSVIVTILLTCSIITGIIAAIAPVVTKQAAALSISVKNFLAQHHDSQYLSEEANEHLRLLFQNLDIQTLIQSEEVQQGITKVVQFLGEGIWAIGNSVLGLAVVFICIMYIIFLLIDYESISKNWIKYIPDRFRNAVQTLLHDLDRNMNAYFRGQASIAFINGMLFAIGFQIIGLPMGIGLGIIIGLLNLVPYMQILGAVPAILLGVIQSVETGHPFWVILLCIAAVFVVVQLIENLILVPKIMGDVTGMGPAWILLSLSIWGALLGFIGMIIALPMTTLLVSYYKRFVLHLPEEPDSKTQKKWNITFFKRKKN